MDKINRNFYVICALLLLFFVGNTGYQVWQAEQLAAQLATEPASYEFSNSFYVPRQGILCPGEWLEYETTFEVNDVPSRTLLERNLRQIDGEYRLLPIDQGAYPLLNDEPFERTIQQRWRLPDYLGPGQYRLITMATTNDAQASSYRVEFAVPEGCEAIEEENN